ncbi:hypothetical protein [Rhodoplanes roseus]|nr:hypothetical protein [Rhodoplanes roseus]
MASLATATFTGQSGQAYEFLAYDRDTEFKSTGAVYVVAIRYTVPNGSSYRHVYVGETRDLSDSPLTHCRTACFERIGANSIFVRLEGNAERRQEIAQDLLETYDPPCNSDREGLCEYPTTECPLVWPLGL